MCTSSLTVIPRDNLLKKIIPEKTKRIHTRDDARETNAGSFQFSGPRKYSFAHVYWPKKAKLTPISISTGV